MKGLFFWQRLLLAVVAIATSALLLNVATDVTTLWYTAWLAPAPLLLFAYYGRFWEAWLVLFLSFSLGSASYILFYQNLLQSHLLWITLLSSAAFAFFLMLTCWICRNYARWWMVFILPLVWVSCEFMQARLTGLGTLGDLAYTQIGFLPMLQIAYLTGIWGVSFMVVLLSNAIVFSIFMMNKPGGRFLCWLLPLLVVLSSLVFGMARISQPQLQDHVNVGLIVLPHDQRNLPVAQKIQRYGELVKRLNRDPVQVAVMPEQTLTLNDHNWVEGLAGFSAIAKRYKTNLILGVDRHYRARKMRKEVWFINAQGQLAGVYDKNAYLPKALSRYHEGNRLLVLNKPSGLWGVALCSDMDFQDVARRYSRSGVGLMFVLGRDSNLHDAYIETGGDIFRGVENDFAVVRVAQGGLVTVSDDRGRILSLEKVRQKESTLLRVYVRLGRGKSVYADAGDWFAYVCLVLSLLFLFRYLSLELPKNK